MGDKEEKRERRFSQEQYDMLKRCSEKRDMTEWNEWRVKNSEVEIRIESANLRETYLYNAHLWEAHLEGANFGKAHIENSDWGDAHIENAYFIQAIIKDADFEKSHLEGARLLGTHIENTNFNETHLEGASLYKAHIVGANFIKTHIESTSFKQVVLDGTTFFWKCAVDRNTDFRGVGLGNVRIDAGTRALLEYNIRRMNWEDWYKKHPVLRWPVKLFWLISDYGHSTGRIVLSFLGSALFFAFLYTLFPGLMGSLSNGTFIHNLYISVTAMTSLGLSVGSTGDGPAMRYILLMVQYILGYVLLGALITRLSILFTTGGPSAKFAPEWKPEKKEPPEQPDEEPASPEPRP